MWPKAWSFRFVPGGSLSRFLFVACYFSELVGVISLEPKGKPRHTLAWRVDDIWLVSLT